MIGIDVSHWQGVIDWLRVKPEVAFAILKCSQGDDCPDPSYYYNKSECERLIIPHGVYHFFEPETDGVKQAEYFYTKADDPSLCFWTLDVEWPGAGLALNLERAVNRLIELTSCLPIIYTNANCWNTTFPVMPEWAKPLKLWVSNPTTALSPYMPSGWDDWLLWQYSWTGQVPGISGSVDLNRFDGTFDDMLYMFGNGGKIIPEPVEERVRVTNPYGLYIRSAPVIATSTVLGGANYGSTWTVMSRVTDSLGREWVRIAPMAYIAGWFTVTA